MRFLDKDKKKNIGEKMAAGVMLLLLFVCLFPVMYLGRYNHPTGDDYYYGAKTKLVWQETGSLAQTLAEAGRGVAREYQIWQGTYSALFLMYLPPNIFGNFPYRLVTVVILSFLMAGIFYLGKQLLCGLLNISLSGWIMISSCLTLLCVETVPTPGESFFWYNGSMYYTGFFAWTLLFLGLVLKYIRKPGHLHLAFLILLALFLGGGNYVTLLPCLIIMVLLSGYLLWKKHPGAAGITTVSLFLLIGLAVSAAAPGNRVRQDGMWKIPAWKAVAKSLLQGIRYAGAWTGIWWILAAFLITPLLWKCFRKSDFRFPYPGLAIGLFYGIFCSMSCPVFYTMNSTGPARVVAAVYYGFVLFSFLSYGYLLGYFQRILAKRREDSLGKTEELRISAEKVNLGRLFRKKGRRAVAAACAVLLILFQVLTGKAAQTTTATAVRLLSDGEAAAYEQEYQERYRAFTDDSQQEIVLQSYQNRPDLLYVGDFSSDPQEPTNVRVAEFFGKASVRVEYDG